MDQVWNFYKGWPALCLASGSIEVLRVEMIEPVYEGLDGEVLELLEKELGLVELASRNTRWLYALVSAGS